MSISMLRESQRPQSFLQARRAAALEVQQEENQSRLPVRVGKFFLEWMKTGDGIKNALKTVYHVCDWKSQVSTPLTAGQQAVRNMTSDAKNVISSCEIPGKTVELGNKFVDFAKAPSLCAFRDIVSSASGLAGPVCDAVSLGVKKNIVCLGPTATTVLGYANSGGLAVGTSIGAAKEFKNIAKEHERFEHAKSARATRDAAHRVMFSALNLGKFGSYSVLGTAGLGSLAFGLPLVPALPLALSTSALFFTIVGHFYGKLNNMDAKKV